MVPACRPARKGAHMASLFRLLLSVPQTLMGGLVFSCMWNWFVIRKFPTMPHLGVMDSVGLLMVLGFPLLGMYLVHAKKEIQESSKNKGKEMSDDAASISLSIAMTVLVYPILLGVAWIWSRIIGV